MHDACSSMKQIAAMLQVFAFYLMPELNVLIQVILYAVQKMTGMRTFNSSVNCSGVP